MSCLIYIINEATLCMNNRLINFNLSHYTKNLEGDILTWDDNGDGVIHRWRRDKVILQFEHIFVMSPLEIKG